MGFFKKLRRLANPLRLNARKPFNPAGVNLRKPLNPLGVGKPANPFGFNPGIPRPGFIGKVFGRAQGIERFRLPEGQLPSIEKTGLQRIGLSENMSFSALGDGMQDVNFRPLNEGLSEAPSIWAGIGQLLGGAASKVIDAKAQAEVLKAQMGLYTPQNIELARRQAEFETAKAGGISSTVLIGAGLAALALVLLLKKK